MVEREKVLTRLMNNDIGTNYYGPKDLILLSYMTGTPICCWFHARFSMRDKTNFSDGIEDKEGRELQRIQTLINMVTDLFHDLFGSIMIERILSFITSRVRFIVKYLGYCS